MNKITQKLSCLLIFALVFTIGCETDSDSSSDNSDFLLSREAKVVHISDSYVEGAISIIRESLGNDLLISSSTPVFILRDSSSGFSKGNATEIRPKASIEYFYYMDNANFSQNPSQYTIERIFVTNP
jgi:hypothetical protein